MNLEDHIQEEHNGDESAFIKAYTEELQTDSILEGPKHFTTCDVKRWVARGFKWVKGRVSQ